MYKKISLIFLVLLTSQLHAETIESGAYQLDNPKEIEINGESFITYDLSLLGEQNTHPPIRFSSDCYNEESKPLNLNLEKSMFAANLAATALAGYGVYKSRNDKLQHIYAGFVISTTVSGAMQMILPKDMKHRKLVSSLIGFGAAVLIGTGKEIRDRQGYGHPSAADAFATYAGGAMGSVSISFTDLGSLFRKR